MRSGGGPGNKVRGRAWERGPWERGLGEGFGMRSEGWLGNEIRGRSGGGPGKEVRGRAWEGGLGEGLGTRSGGGSGSEAKIQSLHSVHHTRSF